MDDGRAFKGVFLALCRIICVICEAEASENNQVVIIGRFFHYLNKGNRIEVRLVGTPKIADREYPTKYIQEVRPKRGNLRSIPTADMSILW